MKPVKKIEINNKEWVLYWVFICFIFVVLFTAVIVATITVATAAVGAVILLLLL